MEYIDLEGRAKSSLPPSADKVRPRRLGRPRRHPAVRLCGVLPGVPPELPVAAHQGGRVPRRGGGLVLLAVRVPHGLPRVPRARVPGARVVVMVVVVLVIVGPQESLTDEIESALARREKCW